MIGILIRRYTRGWGDSLVVKSMRWSCRGPGSVPSALFNSSQLPITLLPRETSPLLISVGTEMEHTRTPPHTHNWERMSIPFSLYTEGKATLGQNKKATSHEQNLYQNWPCHSLIMVFQTSVCLSYPVYGILLWQTIRACERVCMKLWCLLWKEQRTWVKTGKCHTNF